MTAVRLSVAQRAALDAVAAGRVQYGAAYPATARRRGAMSTWPEWLLDGVPVGGQRRRTYTALEERGMIVVRHDLVPRHRVPEEGRSYVSITSRVRNVVIPAHDAPNDPGWRAAVELTNGSVW